MLPRNQEGMAASLVISSLYVPPPPSSGSIGVELESLEGGEDSVCVCLFALSLAICLLYNAFVSGWLAKRHQWLGDGDALLVVDVLVLERLLAIGKGV